MHTWASYIYTSCRIRHLGEAWLLSVTPSDRLHPASQCSVPGLWTLQDVRLQNPKMNRGSTLDEQICCEQKIATPPDPTAVLQQIDGLHAVSDSMPPHSWSQCFLGDILEGLEKLIIGMNYYQVRLTYRSCLGTGLSPSYFMLRASISKSEDGFHGSLPADYFLFGVSCPVWPQDIPRWPPYMRPQQRTTWLR